MATRLRFLWALAVVVLCSSSGRELHSKEQIFEATERASDLYNTGEVYVSMLKSSGNTMVVSVVFKPESRNYWHYHPDAEQTLLVLDGEGFYQEQGGAKRVIKKGDVRVSAPNVSHWNGALPNKSLVCITITEQALENHVVQLRAVTHEEYHFKDYTL